MAKDKNLLYILLPSALYSFAEVGIEKRVIYELNYLSNYFKNIYVISRDNTSKWDLNKNIYMKPINFIKNTKVRFLFLLLLGFIWGFKEIIKADYIFCRYAHGTFIAWPGKILRKKIVLWYPWSCYLQKKGKSKFKAVVNYILELFAFRVADHILSLPEEVIARIKRYSKTRISIFPNFIDTNRFLLKPNKKKLNGVLNIISVSGLKEVKQLDTAINAISRVQNYDIKYVVVGKGKLKNQLQSLGRERSVDLEIIDFISNEALPELLKKCDVFILPSLSEGNPKALMEAMSCGLICIGRNTIGINTLLSDGRGFLFNSNNELEEIFNYILSNYNQSYEKGIKAREFIVKEFSIESILKKQLLYIME